MNVTVSLFSAVSIFLFIASEAPVRADDDQPNRIRALNMETLKTPRKSGFSRADEGTRRAREVPGNLQPIPLADRADTEIAGSTRVERLVCAPTVTICYEYIEDIRKNAPTERTVRPWCSRELPADATLGQFFYVVAHEMGHAMFDLLDASIFGRAEDADGFAVYMMLSSARTKRKDHLGAADPNKDYVQNPNVYVPLIAFADAHGAPMQDALYLVHRLWGGSPIVRRSRGKRISSEKPS